MGSTAAYSALASKTRSMYGQFMDGENYRELMQKRSVNDIAAYLKNNTHYRSTLADIDEATIHRSKLEKVLKRDLMQDYYKLATFSSGSVRSLIKTVYKKHEIETLKLLFRAFSLGKVEYSTIEESLLFLSRYDSINIPKLALSRNVAEFVNGLKGTVYYDRLHPYIGDGKNIELFNIEMALDSLYYTNIEKVVSKGFSGEDKLIIEELVGTEIDLFNLLSIYRCKSFYNMDRDLINSYMIDKSFRLTKADRLRIIDSSGKESLLEQLANTKYTEIFAGKDERFYDYNALEYLYKMHYRMYQHKSTTIACIISYLRLKETEISNIVSLIECVRYKLPEEELKRFVIGLKAEV
jgi:V/A-type H+-transporting ATPase subunit C